MCISIYTFDQRNLTNGTKNKYLDWFKCYLSNPKPFTSYGETKATSKR